MNKNQLLAGFFLMNAAAVSFAATEQASQQVNATVSGTCTVSAADLNLGDYSGAEVENTSNVLISCSTTIGSVGLTASSSNSFKLVNQADNAIKLPYSFYSDSTTTNAWDGSQLTVNLAAGSGTQAVSALIAADQVVAAGTYADSITYTITF